MKKLITTILVPVKLDPEYFTVLKQAAELAIEHGSVLHLLNIENASYQFSKSGFSKISNAKAVFYLLKERSALMSAWKRSLEQEYGIKVVCSVDWGNWKKKVLKYAAAIRADLIVLKEQPFRKRWFDLLPSPVEYIIKKSDCQVITLFSKKDTIAKWIQVVIPVSDFIPQLRIFTIIRSAKIFNIKIHLITVSENAATPSGSSFYFLTETLKLLKPSGNIQVECQYVNDNTNPLNGYLKYARSVGADALLTNNKNHQPAG